jgi:hypothetical protein
MNTKEIKKLIRQKYVRPGEYGISLSRATERLSVAIARKEYRQIVWDHIHGRINRLAHRGSFLDCDTGEITGFRAGRTQAQASPATKRFGVAESKKRANGKKRFVRYLSSFMAAMSSLSLLAF